jgi:hypothetical protein
MASKSLVAQTEMAILDRLIQAEATGFPAAAARSLLKIDFETADRDRMHQLGAKAQDGTLTTAEQAEMDAYEVVGHLLGLMHFKARLALKRRKTSARSEDGARFYEE